MTSERVTQDADALPQGARKRKRQRAADVDGSGTDPEDSDEEERSSTPPPSEEQHLARLGLVRIPAPIPIVCERDMVGWEEGEPFSARQMNLIRALDGVGLEYQPIAGQMCTLSSKLNHRWEDIVKPLSIRGVHNVFSAARTHKTVFMCMLPILARDKEVRPIDWPELGVLCVSVCVLCVSVCVSVCVCVTPFDSV